MRNNNHYIEARGMLFKELKSFRRARRRQIICSFFNAGLAIAIVLALISIIHKTIFNTLHIPLQVFLIFPLILFILSLFRPLKLKEVALEIDDRLKMKERLTTSIDFIDKQDSYTAPLFKDALKRIKGVKPQSLFPVKLNLAISLSAILCAMLFFYDFYDFTKEAPLKIYDLSFGARLAIKKEGERFKKLADKVKTGLSAVEAPGKDIIQQLDKLGEGLQGENIGKHDALLMLSDAAASINELYKGEKGGNKDLNQADKERTISYTKAADLIKNTFNNILKSIESAKRHIAEADIKLNRIPSRRESGQSSFAKDLMDDKPASVLTGETGDTVLSGGLSVYKNVTPRNGRKSVVNDEIYPSKDLEFPTENIILKYPDSVISLESVPRKYHKIVKDYFDAVSGS